ncbi:hypothetical protein GPECTOR_12g350 [Gonium pectorale]|uniref:Uncharacterized protein n=1 Tax=Gonium pectorale TaxID=33097 RepID=A0A150GNM7_GONPE|nr:hypothetical protein GPECTOR_12g350 [Gonium pectorale]|eukprot:KXZ51388.1 hypothetical protein GPECTOR_12g350 [Gonium pectorale]
MIASTLEREIVIVSSFAGLSQPSSALEIELELPPALLHYQRLHQQANGEHEEDDASGGGGGADGAGGAGTPPQRPAAGGRGVVRVAGEEAWQRLQRQLPATVPELLTAQLRACAADARSGAYVVQVRGYAAMWELAVASSGLTGRGPAGHGHHSNHSPGHSPGHGHGHSPGHGHGHGHGQATGSGLGEPGPALEGVWGEAELAQLTRCLGTLFRLPRADRVGAGSAVCCSLAALWWLLKQHAAALRMPAGQQQLQPAAAGEGGAGAGAGAGGAADADGGVSASGEAPTSESGMAEGSMRAGGGGGAGLGAAGPATVTPTPKASGQPAAAFRLQLRRKDRGPKGADARSGVGGAPASAGAGAAAAAAGGASAAPPVPTILTALLSPTGPGGGLARCLAALLKEVSGRVTNIGPDLLREYKAHQQALAAAWAAGLLSELLYLPQVRNELLLAAAAAGAAASHGAAAAAGVTGTAAGGGGGSAAGPHHGVSPAAGNSKRRVALAGAAIAAVGSPGGTGGGTGGTESGEAPARRVSGLASLIGLELDEVYLLLLNVSALPGWLAARSRPPWALRPMGREQAATVIQAALRALVARRHAEGLRLTVSRAMTPTKSMGGRSGALPLSRAVSISPVPRPASPSRPRPLSPSRQPSSPTSRRAGGGLRTSQSQRYFEASAASHPAIAAAEALAGMLARGGSAARDHFATVAPPATLLRLLDASAVPARVSHMGLVLLGQMLHPGPAAESLFRAGWGGGGRPGPGPGGGGPGGGGGGGGAAALAGELLRVLAPWVALEQMERAVRYGPSERRPYAGVRADRHHHYHLSPHAAARAHTPPPAPPLVDGRWGSAGSELSVHAAAAAWGVAAQLGKLWVAEAEAAAKRAATGGSGAAPWQQQQGQQARPASAYGPFGGSGGGGLGTAAAAGPVGPLEEATHRLMSMTVAGLCSGRTGPATHTLCAALVHMAVPCMAAAALMFLAKEAARRAVAAAAAAAAAPPPPPTHVTPRRRPRVRMAAGGTVDGFLSPRGPEGDAVSPGGGDSARSLIPLHGDNSHPHQPDGGRPSPHSPNGHGEGRDASTTGYPYGEYDEEQDPLGLDPDLPYAPELGSLLRLLMGEDFRTLKAALQVLPQLLGRPEQRLLQHACLAAFHLAGVAGGLMRGPLGRAGVVTGLVGVLRRWYDLPPSEQRAFRATGEWALAALVRLTAEPGGARNRHRLAQSYRDDSAAVAAATSGSAGAVRTIFAGYGYAMSDVPGRPPQKRTGRTGSELDADMRWGGGWSWGTRGQQTGRPSEGAGQVEMCSRCARLLLHINAAHSGAHGYVVATRGLLAAPLARQMAAEGGALPHGGGGGGGGGGAGAGAGGGPPHSPPDGASERGGGAGGSQTESAALPPSIHVESLSASAEILYSSSGCLANLSRHPANRDALYRLELAVAGREALADLAAEATERPPRVPGLSRPQAAAALLTGALRAADTPASAAGSSPPTSPRRIAPRWSMASGGSAGSSRSGVGADIAAADGGGGGGDGGDPYVYDSYGGSGGGQRRVSSGGVSGGVWSYGSGGAATPFVPHYMRDEVRQYVSYGAHLQEMLSRPLHAAGEGGAAVGGGGGGGGGTDGGDDTRSMASGRTGVSSVVSAAPPPYPGRARSVRKRASEAHPPGPGLGLGAGPAGGGGGGSPVGGGGGGGGGGSGDEAATDLDRCRSGGSYAGSATGDDEDGEGGDSPFDRAFPRLATLTKHLSKPLSRLWAPLLVDRHDGAAVPLFGLAAEGEGEAAAAAAAGQQPGRQVAAAAAAAVPAVQLGTGTARRRRS